MYKPLEYAKNIDFSFFNENYKLFYKKELNFDFDSNKEDLLEFTLSKEFMHPLYSGKFKEINQLMMDSAHIMFPSSKNRIKEWAEVIEMVSVLEMWKENKQVYKVDDDFIQELIVTDNINIPLDILNQLPYQTYCIDFTENTYFPDIDEAYVHLRKIDGELYIFIDRVIEDVFFTLMIRFSKEEIVSKGGFSYYNYSRSSIPETSDYLEVSKDVEKRYSGMKIRNYNFKDFCIFNIQLLLYLCAVNADVQESPTTKSTYRPIKNGTKPKNKFSEVRQWEVGVRIGNTIRKNKEPKSEEIQKRNSSGTGSPRKVSPHCRRAHWQHYHIGPGRKETVLKWIGITFVNGTKEDIPVTIHNVKI